jgi:hypothetical protein
MNIETSISKQSRDFIPKLYIEMSVYEELSAHSLPANIYAMHYKAPSAYDEDLDVSITTRILARWSTTDISDPPALSDFRFVSLYLVKCSDYPHIT